jgi:hypothetical protein
MKGNYSLAAILTTREFELSAGRTSLPRFLHLVGGDNKSALELRILSQFLKKRFLRLGMFRKHLQQRVLQLCALGYLAKDPQNLYVWKNP